MGSNLLVLGLQSIHSLAEVAGVEIEFSKNVLSKSLRVEEFQKNVERCERILSSLLKDFKISWWDVYRHSDIGKERLEITKEMDLEKTDSVLDIGCGRGYFSIAAALSAKSVLGVDLMNGYGRYSWWRNFKVALNELNLDNKISGVKSNAVQLPFKSRSFDVAATVHSIRNFRNYSTIEVAVKEMKRSVVEGGSVCLIESLPISRTKAQEAHLLMFKCKVKFASGELDFLPKESLVEIFERVGFKELIVKELDYSWSAAPPLFCIDYYLPSIPERERKGAKDAYDEAVEMIEKWGEVSPPALFLKGIV